PPMVGGWWVWGEGGSLPQGAQSPKPCGWIGFGGTSPALCWGQGRFGLTSPCAGGETEEEIQRVDMLENQIMDFRMSLVMVCYNPDFEKLKPGYLEQLPGKLKLFSNFLGDRKWFAGEKALEKVAAYMKSSRFQKMPINNKMAKWGNKKL
uniref:glutathione transferase n=1 Tax=Ficedula albicollis TaxID=59894 RepID=A0A803VXF1_FICAL